MAEETKTALSLARSGTLKPISDAEKTEIWNQAGLLIKAGLYPSKYKRPEEAFAAALYGRELGLSPQRAWKTIHVIEGMPGLEVHQQVTFAREAIPGLVWGIKEHTMELCTIEHGRPGGKLYETTYLFEEAKLAGLDTKKNWRASRKDMLYARAATRAIKWYYPETQGGLVHSVEELRDVVEEVKVRETGAPRSEKVVVTDSDTNAQEASAPPDLEAQPIEDPKAVETLRRVLEFCEDKNKVDLEYGKWRTTNAGKPHTLLEGYDLVSAKLFALANPAEAQTPKA